jgi:hypothetical protein
MSPTYSERLAALTPRQWSLTLERVHIIDRYLEIERPTAEDADAYAEILRIGRSNFYRLVRIFREQRQSCSAKTETRKRSMISSETEAVIQEVISELGAATGPARISREATRRCEERGISVPSLNATRTRLATARRAAPVTTTLPPLALDHCGLRMNLRLDDGVTATAVISVLIHTPSGQLLGHYLTGNAPTAASAAHALLDALSSRPPRSKGQRSAPALLVEIDEDSAWGPITEALVASGIQPLTRDMSERSPGQIMLRTLGMRLGKIALAPRKTFHCGALPKAPVVPIKDAEAILRELIQQHNAAITTAKPVSLITLIGQTPADRLRVDLRNVLGGQP